MTPIATRRHWPILVIAMLFLTSLVTLAGFFFVRGQRLMDERLRESLRVMAVLSAGQFDAADIDSIRGPKSMDTPLFQRTVDRLKAIRDQAPSIQFVYIMRRTGATNQLEFVADADSLATDDELDLDDNGIVEEHEEGSYPGDPYDIAGIPAMQEAAFEGPVVDEEFTTDQWGTVISGYAPIRDAKGRTVAILGIDMNARDYLAIQGRFFSQVVYLLVVMCALALAGTAAYYLWSRQSDEWHAIDAERSGLLQIASHRLGGPLTVFQWSAEFLRDALNRGDSDDITMTAREHVEHIDEGIKQLSSILSELKEASDVETGALAYKREVVALNDVIHGVVRDFAGILQRRGQRLHVQVDPHLTLALDRTLIGGVLHELLQNAIMFSRDNADISIAGKRMGRRAFVEVRDHGCGMDLADVRRMFGKFVRGHDAHLHHPNGSGLGLYIAKGIVERAGGEIRIKSVLGKGTTVTFTLPC